jgi:branched-chain amino acid transport system substrate-binding protein
VVAATNEITDWTAGGLVPPVDWSRQHTAPTVDDPVTNGPVYDCSAFLVVTGGALELSGDPAKPFYCFDPIDQDSVEPTPMTFD